MRDYEIKSNGIVVDFTKDTGIVIPKKMIYTSGDINTSYIRITCNNNDKPIDLFRYEVNINIVRKDGSYLNAECTVVDAARGEIEVMLTTSMLYVGLNHLEVMLSMGDKQLVSPMIPYKVVTSISSDMDENIPNTNEYPILIQLIGEVKALPEKLDRELTPIVKGKIDLMNKTIQDGNQYLEYANNNEAERQSNEEIRKTQELSRQESINSMTSSFNNKVGEVNAKILEATNITNENTKKIDNKIVDIQSQLDTRVATKFTEVDGTVGTKLTQLQNQVDAKILDVDASKDNMISTVNSKIVEVDGAKTDMVSQVGNKIVDADGKIVDCENRMQVIENTFGDLVGGTGYATTQYVDTKVSGIVNSAPEALDTLKELSDALGNDPNFATTIATQIGEKANKVDVYNKQEVDNAIANITIDTSNLATKEDVGLVDMKTETNKSDILTVKNELDKSVNAKYSTLNGNKEFECKDGYIDNIYMEGKTLVNLSREVFSYTIDIGGDFIYRVNNTKITCVNNSNKVICILLSDSINGNTQIRSISLEPNSISKHIISPSEYLWCYRGYASDGWNKDIDNSIFKSSLIVLEGDHTSKQIPYFEGLKSIGQDDKIEVLSYKGDTIPFTFENGWMDLNNGQVGASGSTNLRTNDYVNVVGVNYIYCTKLTHILLYDSNKTFIKSIRDVQSGTYVDLKNVSYIKLWTVAESSSLKILSNSECDKKQILTTLRGLPNGLKDEMVKIGNSYKKIERCKEIITTGNETLTYNSTSNIMIYNIGIDLGNASLTKLICDKYDFNTSSGNKEGILYDHTNKRLRITTSKFGTSDNVNNAFANFEKDFKDNPITIVYELDEPRIIDLPNFNPQTFDNKTTLLLNSGVVQGECEFDVTNSLRNEIDVLKDKVSDLDDYVVHEEVYYPTLLNGWTDRYSSNPIKISKVGNIVIIEGNLISGVVSANTHIMTLPNKVLPKRNMFTTIISRGSKIILGTFNIGLDGRVIIQDNGFGDASTSSGGICFSYSYSLI